MNEFSENRRASFQRQMVKRVAKLVEASYNPNQLQGFFIEYFYEPRLNFGVFFRAGRRLRVPFEVAYEEAVANCSKTEVPMLIVSRPSDNYYAVINEDHLAARWWSPTAAPSIHWKMGDHSMLMMNLKAWLAL